MSDFLSKKGKHMETKGLVLINTGTGKGKTTAALGTAIRAWGDGQKVLILQFIKGAWKYGELKAIETLGKAEGRIEIRPMGDGFVFHNKKDPENEERLAEKKELARRAWDMVRKEVMSGAWDLIVLDEINYAIHFGMLETEEVARLIRERPVRLNMILTGRYAPKELIDLVDTVTEMTLVKHAFQKGIRARKGIEF
ncbi:cob(I)yrinic acid a,c-diamide adenosyltransferase [uncultured Dialister sp.]|uniref:cob(I)yrinic acid a,c-diamide adenosyltransferase n=1 Tax=uncultured Dialister sp. TaxID=278064 RepID=UPI002599D133|nr:cob(I)yrinic acid a,c-diamide adenosyltransferase [uncultured Dialister sp.]